MDNIDGSLKTDGSGAEEDNASWDRVTVVLDVRNIVCGQSQVYSNAAMDFGKLLQDVLEGRRCVLSVAVDGVSYDERGRDASRLFHDELRRSGFRVDLVEATNGCGKQEGADVEIALTAYDYAGRCDVVELITGDGDFSVLVRRLQQRGVRVNVTSFFGGLSDRLGRSADRVRIMDRMPLVRMGAGTPGAE
jgi:uncharacterized LabA/DUF88 family protein